MTSEIIDKKMDNKKLVEEISNMRSMFQDIQSIFKSEDPNVEYSEYVEELVFMMDKLEVLMGITKDSKAKKECGNLFMSIKEYREEENILEYEIKNKIIFELIDLTSVTKKVYRSDIVLGVNRMGKLLQINPKDLESIRDRDLIFYSKLSMGINKDIEISDKARLLISKELLVTLLEFVFNSYEDSKLPFSFYEKIMIINILDEIRLTI